MDLATLTTVLVRVFLVVTMLSIGLRLSGTRLASGGPGRRVVGGVLVANLILVPLVGVLVAGALGLAAGVTVGILATALAPAGSLGPKFVQVARGDLRFGVLAMFALSVIATVTLAPSLAFAEGLLGLQASVTPIQPIVVIASLAIFQLVPMLIGLAIARRASTFARRAVEPLTRASTVLIVTIVVVAIVDTADELVRLGPKPLLAMLVIALAGALFGWVGGGPDTAIRRASVIVTAQRATGLAFLVVAGPGHAVETATVAAFALILLIVNSILATGLGRPWPALLPVRRRGLDLPWR